MCVAVYLYVYNTLNAKLEEKGIQYLVCYTPVYACAYTLSIPYFSLCVCVCRCWKCEWTTNVKWIIWIYMDERGRFLARDRVRARVYLAITSVCVSMLMRAYPPFSLAPLAVCVCMSVCVYLCILRWRFTPECVLIRSNRFNSRISITQSMAICITFLYCTVYIAYIYYAECKIYMGSAAQEKLTHAHTRRTPTHHTILSIEVEQTICRRE